MNMIPQKSRCLMKCLTGFESFRCLMYLQRKFFVFKEQIPWFSTKEVENVVQKVRKTSKPPGPNDAVILLEILHVLERDDMCSFYVTMANSNFPKVQ